MKTTSYHIYGAPRLREKRTEILTSSLFSDLSDSYKMPSCILCGFFTYVG